MQQEKCGSNPGVCVRWQRWGKAAAVPWMLKIVPAGWGQRRSWWWRGDGQAGKPACLCTGCCRKCPRDASYGARWLGRDGTLMGSFAPWHSAALLLLPMPSLGVHPVGVQLCRGAGVLGCRGTSMQFANPSLPPQSAGRIVPGRRSCHCAAGRWGVFVPAGLPGSQGRHAEIKGWAVGSAAAMHRLLPLRSCCCYGVYCCQLSPGALHPAPCFFTGWTIMQTIFAPIVAFSHFFPFLQSIMSDNSKELHNSSRDFPPPARTAPLARLFCPKSPVKSAYLEDITNYLTWQL